MQKSKSCALRNAWKTTNHVSSEEDRGRGSSCACRTAGKKADHVPAHARVYHHCLCERHGDRNLMAGHPSVDLIHLCLHQ